MIKTSTGIPIDEEFLNEYFKTLVNGFFKILPMKEGGEESLPVYMRSLQVELVGCRNLISFIHDDPSYITILSILEYLIGNPECTVKEVKREVFRAISIINRIRAMTVEEVIK